MTRNRSPLRPLGIGAKLRFSRPSPCLGGAYRLVGLLKHLRVMLLPTFGGLGDRPVAHGAIHGIGTLRGTALSR